MLGHEREAREFRSELAVLTTRIHDNNNSRTEINRARGQRRLLRRNWKLSLQAWESAWWDNIISETQAAEGRRDIGGIYRILRKLGMRNCRGKVTCSVSLADFRTQFSSASAQRHEIPWEVMEAVVEGIPRDFIDAGVEAAAALGEEITPFEVRREWARIRDGAAGEDGVRVSFVKRADLTTQSAIAEMVAQLARTSPDQWDETIKTGLVVPLFKKGDRTEARNYRGICLLSVATRLLARVLASRLRVWAENVGIMGDWQHGFRTGRSTADAAQMFVRMHEELRKEYLARGDSGSTSQPDDPIAILLDLEKAYPRVSRPLLWAILRRLGVPPAVTRTLQGLHEETSFKVRGKAGVSAAWLPVRGLHEGCATSPIFFNISMQ